MHKDFIGILDRTVCNNLCSLADGGLLYEKYKKMDYKPEMAGFSDCFRNG